jgi:uncharacterized membrane protein (UPF0182 family)
VTSTSLTIYIYLHTLPKQKNHLMALGDIKVGQQSAGGQKLHQRLQGRKKKEKIKREKETSAESRRTEAPPAPTREKKEKRKKKRKKEKGKKKRQQSAGGQEINKCSKGKKK